MDAAKAHLSESFIPFGDAIYYLATIVLQGSAH